MKPHSSFIPTLLLLMATTLFFEVGDGDLLVQDLFYQFDQRAWWIDKDEPVKRLIFYSGAKKVIIFFGLSVLGGYFLSFKKSRLVPYRRQLLLIALSLIFVPSLVAGAKNITNIHCPWALERYGADKPYIKLFEPYPDDFIQERPGKCFPAGHPTGGFAFMVLYFVLKTPRAKRLGLGFGLGLGWIMGIYQMLKGAHFLSHVLFSMMASWLVILLVVAWVDRKGHR
ncbi:MAG: phosphatase PAP2 family protein [Magnetococcales bacterium]|nr:phosphatase PAP2 family protein [Magnetococcales bacterium]